jgi:hypothetical protein
MRYAYAKSASTAKEEEGRTQRQAIGTRSARTGARNRDTLTRRQRSLSRTKSTPSHAKSSARTHPALRQSKHVDAHQHNAHAFVARTPMLQCTQRPLLRVTQLALFVKERANVLRQFCAQKLNACRFRIRAEHLVGRRNLRRSGIHDLSPLRIHYVPRAVQRTSAAARRRCFGARSVALTAHGPRD